MKLKSLSALPALAFGLCALTAHADTSFLFTLDNGNYPSISATTPDSFVYDRATGYYETTGVVVQQLGEETTESLLIFGAKGIDFASKDADISTLETIFDGTSFLDGTYSALLSNDYPERLTGIPEGLSLAGTLVISSATPEPSSLMLLATGVLGAAGMVRRRRNGSVPV